MKRILLLGSLLMLSTAMTRADNTAVQILTADGDGPLFMLEERPQVACQGDMLVITAGETVVNYPLADRARFVFVDEADVPTAISQTTLTAPRPVVRISGQTMTVDGLQPGTALRVADVRGRLVATAVADAQGHTAVSFTQKQRTIYVVETSTATFKIIK